LGRYGCRAGERGHCQANRTRICGAMWRLNTKSKTAWDDSGLRNVLPGATGWDSEPARRPVSVNQSYLRAGGRGAFAPKWGGKNLQR
jgi:hypothetical protein